MFKSHYNYTFDIIICKTFFIKMDALIKEITEILKMAMFKMFSKMLSGTAERNISRIFP